MTKITERLTHKEMIWLLDNGHGINTKGKRSPIWKDKSQLFEYDFNRRVVKLLSFELKSAEIDHRVIVKELEGIPLKERVKRANDIAKSNLCILLSIHGNAFKDEKIHGIETFHYLDSEDGKYFATLFQNNLIKDTGWKDRGIKTAGFYILKHTIMPAILMELGFYTNYKQCQEMLKINVQYKLAMSIFNTIKSY